MVDAGVYVDGRRVASPTTVVETARALRETPGALAWIGLFRPTDAQFRPVAEEFGLHELAVEDAIVAHQRPKLERYGDALFVVLRAATYLDADEEVEFGEIHVFVGPNFVLTVRHSRTPDLSVVRHRMESSPELLALGRRRSCTRSSTPSSTASPRSSPGWRRTSTRSRRRSSAATRQVSRRIYELSGEVHRVPALDPPAPRHVSRASPPASTSTARTRSSSATCATSPTMRPPSPSASRASARTFRTSSRSTRRS